MSALTQLATGLAIAAAGGDIQDITIQALLRGKMRLRIIICVLKSPANYAQVR
ncbi:MAG: hypothetical protein J6563_00455 [Gilliamella sp.]|uniref:hypothetical protein n=1 Tax=Gilliamella sp. TaxID=1891236 RepID=UPI00345AB795|nr:hypothetical protein [Gilliamella sp.]